MEIPQEENTVLEGHKKVMYAKGTDGTFDTHSYGSKAEEFATQIAVQEYELLAQACLADIEKGIASPIEYYRYKNRMDLPTLIAHMGMMSFRVKRHLKMKHFAKLNDTILRRYADVFSITLDDLKNFTPKTNDDNI